MVKTFIQFYPQTLMSFSRGSGKCCPSRRGITGFPRKSLSTHQPPVAEIKSKYIYCCLFKEGLSCLRAKEEEITAIFLPWGRSLAGFIQGKLAVGSLIFIRNQIKQKQHKQERNGANPWQGPRKVIATMLPQIIPRGNSHVPVEVCCCWRCFSPTTE